MSEMLLFTTSVTHSVSYRDGENSDIQGFMAHSVLKYLLLILISVSNNVLLVYGIFTEIWSVVENFIFNCHFLKILDMLSWFTFKNDPFFVFGIGVLCSRL